MRRGFHVVGVVGVEGGGPRGHVWGWGGVGGCTTEAVVPTTET